MEDLIGANPAKWKLLPSISFLASCCRDCPKAAEVAVLPHVDVSEALQFPQKLQKQTWK